MQLQSIVSGRAKRYYIALLTCGLFGALASFVLTYEKIHLLQNPTEAPACSINPIITCASAMTSSQSEVFGIPISMFGLVAYTALVTVAILLMTGSVLYRVVWYLVLASSILGLLGMHYLLFQSIFVLHVICPWCFGVWLTGPLIFAAVIRLFVENNAAPSLLQSASAHIGKAVIAWYVLLIATLTAVFWDAWQLMLGL
jgi:uncharacterized membrane protein